MWRTYRDRAYNRGMAWVKIPKEHHPVMMAALPRDPRVETLKMFGGVAGLVNGNMFGGLFAKSAVAKLNDADRAEALELDGAELFDPMGNGRVMQDTVMLPEEVFHDAEALAEWMRRAFDHTATLPPKKKKDKSGPKKGESSPKKDKPVAKKEAKAAAKKPAAKKPAAKKSAVKKPTAKRSAAKKSAAKLKRK
jgi:TfoX/Sxy family transcriptional regulator of competence genes